MFLVSRFALISSLDQCLTIMVWVMNTKRLCSLIWSHSQVPFQEETLGKFLINLFLVSNCNFLSTPLHLVYGVLILFRNDSSILENIFHKSAFNYEFLWGDSAINFNPVYLWIKLNWNDYSELRVCVFTNNIRLHSNKFVKEWQDIV